jgi:phytoene desaturase (3,4-didehydrolycopene-forming)
LLLFFFVFFFFFFKSHGFAQLSLTRPGPASSGLSNVLYCGASTRPGNGVPLVLIGAKQVAEKAVRSLNTQITTD